MTLNDKSFIGAVALFHLARTTGSRAAEHRAKAERLLGLLQKSDARPAYGRGLAEALTSGGLTHSLAMPVNRYRLTVKGELIALPAAEMGALKSAREIHLDIDSNGGDSRAAIEILDICGDRLTKVRVKYAASASAILAVLAPGRRTIAKDGEIMLHGLGSCAMGTAAHFRRMADWLDSKTGPIAQRIVERTGQKLETVRGWLGDTDVTFTAEQALAFGLVDRIE